MVDKALLATKVAIASSDLVDLEAFCAELARKAL
jgi:hypothetical protein